MFDKTYDAAWEWLTDRIKGCAQDPESFKPFCKEIWDMRPKSLVEVGTQHGGSLYVMAMCCPKDCRLWNVDPRNPADYGVVTGELKRLGRRHQVVQSRSWDWRPEVIWRGEEYVWQELPEKGVDVLFYDGYREPSHFRDMIDKVRPRLVGTTLHAQMRRVFEKMDVQGANVCDIGHGNAWWWAREATG